MKKWWLVLAALGLAACPIYGSLGDWEQISAETTGGPAGTGGAPTTTSITSTTGAGGASICTPGATQSCYDGPTGTLGVGTCKGGTATCAMDGKTWGPCTGESLPPCTPTVLWARRFGDSAEQTGNAVAVDSAGNVLITGRFLGTVDFGGNVLTSAGAGDVFVAKFDPTGAPLWSARFGDQNEQSGTGIAVDATGNVLVTGSFQGKLDFGGGTAPLASVGTGDLFVAKLDPTGKTLWSKGFGHAGDYQQATAIVADGAGAVVLTGAFHDAINFGGATLSTPGPAASIFLAKFDAAGSHVWSKGYGDGSGSALAVDGANDVFVTGIVVGTANFGGAPIVATSGASIFAAKLGPSGSYVWSKGFGNGSSQSSHGIAVDSGGGVLLTGSIQGALSFGGPVLPGSIVGDAFLVKLDSTGAHQWSQRFGQGVGTAVAVDSNANPVVTGTFSGSANFGGGAVTSVPPGSLFIAKLDASGAYQWAAAFGQGGSQITTGIAVDATGDSFFTGYFKGTLAFGSYSLASTGGTTGGNDIFLVKVSP